MLPPTMPLTLKTKNIKNTLHSINMMNFKNRIIALIAGVMMLGQLQATAQEKHTFALGDFNFMLDGKPFQMISGEMHYPRVPREAWRARMKMAKAMGLNTIGTYVFWNLHEPQKGKFDFTGNNDVAEFVKIAQQEGLWVILRPSPYVCAEWEFGGYPYWLQNEKGLVVRSKEESYLKEYEKYINEVGKQLAPLQINHGGNILMVQIENEYGSYGSDKEYLKINQDLFKKAGFDGLLYTCDPANDVKKGHLPGLLPAVNGLDNPAKVKALVNSLHDGKGPYYIAEWYPAWFDWWGTKHHTVAASQYTARLDSVLAAGISINMYMFHGGTTRGFMNGANYNDRTPFEPQISSYDYDAPLDEAGNATEKYMAFRGVIEKYLPAGVKLPAVPAVKPAMAIASIKLSQSAGLLQNLPVPKSNASPLTFEDLNQDYGFVLYRTILTDANSGLLKLKELRDYAVVMVDGKIVGTLDRRTKTDSMQITLPKGKVTLDILVENLGRINFGKYLLQNKKGITEKVLLNNQELSGWNMYSIPFENLSNLKYVSGNASGAGPVVKQGSFNLNTVADTYLDMRAWGKGLVWINGHNLGKYWSIGPQQTLYVPAEWLKKGNNKIEVLELLKPGQTELSALAKPILNQLQ
jgi:beta-galactosidase